MKINKLLLFLLALVSLNSCVEYVDNGVVPEGPEKPEEQVFVAKLSEESEGEFVGDEFIFEATLNGVDVTSSTTFKVNGVDAKGNVFKAIKEGENAVLATMDDFTSTFRFTVKEKDEEEPEPTGNRIEYDGDWKPVTNTFWLGYGDPAEGFNPYNVTPPGASSPVLCTKWLIVSMDASDPEDAENLYLIDAVFIPADVTDPNNPIPNYPHQATDFYYTNDSSASFVFDTNDISMTSNEFDFISGTPPNKGVGTANYTATAQLDGSKEGKLFWDGDYTYGLIPDNAPKSAKGISKLSNVDFTKSLQSNSTKINLKKLK